ncbi:MAG: hypothetical protein JNM93_11180 [Bacteriovoracaceae bacterium]|nr:hypothetical protein [Bacteriovoracaceae bacterium]
MRILLVNSGYFLKVLFVIVNLAFSIELFAKSVVLIQSYPDGVWTKGIVNGATETLQKFSSNFNIINYVYDSEILRHKDFKEQEKVVTEILNKIKQVNPSYIILNDDEAVEKFINKLDPKLNIIINGINDVPENIPGVKKEKLNSLCGIIEDFPIEQSIRMITLMSSKIKQMSVISSNNISSQIVARKFEKLQKDKTQKIKLRKIYLSDSWEEWKIALMKINKVDDLTWILVPYEIKNKKNINMSLIDIAKWVRKNVRIPILGILSINTKMGFLSAISIDPYGLGRQAAEVVIRMEQSETCSKIGFEKYKYLNFEINKDEVRRLGLKVPSEFMGIARFIEDKDLILGER